MATTGAKEPAKAVCDTCVLINLAVINELRLLGQLNDLRFYVPQTVLDELRQSGPRQAVRSALAQGWLRKVSLDSEREDAVAQALNPAFGAGESACLAIAQCRDWYVATDETGALVREIQNRVGPGRQINTVAILVAAIRRKLLTVDKADAHKAKLEAHQFRMKFGSFAEAAAP